MKTPIQFLQREIAFGRKFFRLPYNLDGSLDNSNIEVTRRMWIEYDNCTNFLGRIPQGKIGIS